VVSAVSTTHSSDQPGASPGNTCCRYIYMARPEKTAQHHRVAVGKDDDVKYAAEKYGESHGDQCVHHAQHKAVDDELNEE